MSPFAGEYSEGREVAQHLVLHSVTLLVSPFCRERGRHIEERSETREEHIGRHEGLRLRSHRCPGGLALEGGGRLSAVLSVYY